MDASPKLLISVVIVAGLSACAIHLPWETTPAAATAASKAPAAPPPTAEAPSPTEKNAVSQATTEKQPNAKDSGVVIVPLPAPDTSPPKKVPAVTPEAEGAAPPAAETPPPTVPAVTKAPAPAKAMTVVADRTPRAFTLTVARKNPSHPYYGRGHDVGFVVDGVQGKELVLTRGVTYVFHVDTNIQHDFYFSTSPYGRGVGTVTDGITGQYTYRGDVTFTPGASTPDVVYYECRNHAYMGGKIHIANAGDKVKIGGAEDRASPEIGKTKQPKVSATQVKQKLNYAEMLMQSSPAMKRVEASNNTQAKGLAAHARRQIADSKVALGAGDNEAAMRAVDESLRLISDAAYLVPDPNEQIDYKSRYADLSEQLRGFDKSYERNIKRGIKPKAGQGLDKVKFDKLVKEAAGLADRSKYKEAVKRLESANEMLTQALGQLLQSQTMVYDKNFATPKDEYEYELSRYQSYAELIPLAVEQRKPSEQTVAMMDKLAARAKEIRDEGVGLAAKGNHKKAIMALQAATGRLQQALRLAGVQ